MDLTFDKSKGMIKVYWNDIRELVKRVEPTFVNLVDILTPDNDFPLFLAYYPYGAIIADTKGPFFPNGNGKICKLSDKSILDAAQKHLNYGNGALPMGIVLEKQLEYFIDLQQEGIIIPWLVYKPGSFFPFSTIFEKKSQYCYSPNDVLIATAGIRSTFMLPNIGCATNHINLKREFNIKRPAPKNLYDHWFIFKDIINSKLIDVDWHLSILYFSEIWIKKLRSDKAWLTLKSYLLEKAWLRFEFDRNRTYYDVAFSIIQKKRNLKPNPYLTDTAKHLFNIGIGAAPAFAPTINEEGLPLNILQKVFYESYNLKKYFPTVMQVTNFNFLKKDYPVYYSLQHPSMYCFSPKSRKVSSTIFEVRELEHIMGVFCNELSKMNAICADTILGHVARYVRFDYYHNEKDQHKIIKHSSEIENSDQNFNFPIRNLDSGQRVFSQDSKFLRGCISISA